MSLSSDYEALYPGRTVSRVVFVNTDATGNSVYRFEYTYDSSPSPLVWSGASGSTTLTVTQDKRDGSWTFTEPNYHSEGSNPLEEGVDAFNEILDRPPTRMDPGSFTTFVGDLDVPAIDPSETAAETAARERGYATIMRWAEEGRFGTGQAAVDWANAMMAELAALSDLSDIEGFTNVIPPSLPGERDFLSDTGIDGGGGGGGGRAGAVGPVYRAPDRRVIEDQIKGMLVSLLGTVDESLVQEFTNLHMKEDKRNWDSPTETIDPSMSVLEAVRNTSQYKSIHKLRPDSVDERQWISDRRSAALRGGLNTADLEQFAIGSAASGSNLGDVPFSAAVSQFGASGVAPPLLDEKFRRVATSVFGRVIR